MHGKGSFNILPEQNDAVCSYICLCEDEKGMMNHPGHHNHHSLSTAIPGGCCLNRQMTHLHQTEMGSLCSPLTVYPKDIWKGNS